MAVLDELEEEEEEAFASTFFPPFFFFLPIEEGALRHGTAVSLRP